MACHVSLAVKPFFKVDRVGHGRPWPAVSFSLHLPLLQITDQLRQGNGGYKPLFPRRAGDLLGIKEVRLAVALDLALRPGDPRCGKAKADLGDGQGVTELVSVRLWPAMAGYVSH